MYHPRLLTWRRLSWDYATVSLAFTVDFVRVLVKGTVQHVTFALSQCAPSILHTPLPRLRQYLLAFSISFPNRIASRRFTAPRNTTPNPFPPSANCQRMDQDLDACPFSYLLWISSPSTFVHQPSYITAPTPQNTPLIHVPIYAGFFRSTMPYLRC